MERRPRALLLLGCLLQLKHGLLFLTAQPLQGYVVDTTICIDQMWKQDSERVSTLPKVMLESGRAES